MPKAHLHLHLEGAMRPGTLAELSSHYGLPEPLQPDGSFSRFIQLYRAACEALRSPDDLRRLVREIAEDAAADGVVWVEPATWLTATGATRVGVHDAEAVLEVLLDAAREAGQDTHVGIGLMVSSNRVHPPRDAVTLAHLAARHAGRGVVAFGLADDETRAPPEPFAAAFAVARKAGLISAPHAGEHGGPDSVRGALDALGARRIEHGVRAAEDPWLLERLAAEEVCLDVCPTSNVQLRVTPNYAQHPLKPLLDAGVQVSLNADDPLFFGSGVLAEYELARHTFGLDDATLARIAASSIRASGAPESIKVTALAAIDRWLA
ncbi:MAG: adenosine deaminase [Chloroflexota bacterium]